MFASSRCTDLKQAFPVESHRPHCVADLRTQDGFNGAENPSDTAAELLLLKFRISVHRAGNRFKDSPNLPAFLAPAFRRSLL